LKEPPDPVVGDCYATKSHINERSATDTRGFHFGCIPSTFFKDRCEQWERKEGKTRGGFWIKVIDHKAIGGPHVEKFQYKIGEVDVTRYFGQIAVGWEEALRTSDISTESTLLS